MNNKTIWVLTLLILSAGFVGADIVPNPSSASVSQEGGSSSVYSFILSNTGNTTENIVTYMYGTAQSWVSIPGTISLNAGMSQTIYYTVDIPSSTSTGTYSVTVQSLGTLQNTTDHVLTLDVTEASNSSISDDWFQIAYRDWFDMGDVIEFGDYKLRIQDITSTKVEFDAYDDDDLEETETVREGHNVTILDDNRIRVYVHDADDEDDCRLSIYSDDEDYDIDVTDADDLFPYILVNNQQFSKGTSLNFGQFYLTFDFIAYNGIYVTTVSGMNMAGQTTTCIYDTECNPHETLKLTINSLSATSTGGGSATITINAKEQYIVTTTSQQLTSSNCNYNSQCEYWLGEGQTCADCSTSYSSSGGLNTNTVGQSVAGNMVVQLRGGTIAPGHKVYFGVTDQNYFPIQTGLITIDAGPTPVMADVSNGLAKIDLPWDLRCPMGITASSTGYQTTTQIFSTCTEEGGINWTSLAPGATTTTLPENDSTEGDPQLILTHSGDGKLDSSTTVTVVANSAGVSGVSMQITPPDNNLITTTTNTDGKITITLDKVGTWTITAAKNNYLDGTHTFTVERKPITIDFSPSSPQMGDSVEAIIKSDGTNIGSHELTVSYPDGSTLTKTTNSNGRITIDVEDVGEYKVLSPEGDYITMEQNFNVPGKELVIALSPLTPVCGQTTFLSAKDDAGAPVSSATFKIDGVASMSNWNPKEGTHQLIANAEGYNEVGLEVNIECAAILTIPPVDITTDDRVYAQFNKAAEWNIQCTNEDGQPMVGTASGNGEVVNESVSEAGNCFLKWSTYTRQFKVEDGGWGLPKFDSGGNTLWYIVAALALVGIAVYGNKQGWFDRGGARPHFPLKPWGGKGGPLVDRQA